MRDRTASSSSSRLSPGASSVHQEKPHSRIRDKLVLRVIKTTYGAVLMENAEILHTSIPRGMYAEIDTVQHTANALRDGNGAYRSSEWCALQGSKSSRACPQSSGGCRSLQSTTRRAFDAQCYRVVVLHHHVLYPLPLFVAGLCYLCEAVDSCFYIC